MAYPIEKARTQYNDLRGTISVDFPGDPGRTEFENYVENIGIDLKKYDPQGFEIYRGENSNIKDIKVTIFAIDKEKRGEYERQNDGRVPIVKFHYVDTFINFLDSIHRMDIICMKGYYGDSNIITNLDIIDDIYPKEEEED